MFCHRAFPTLKMVGEHVEAACFVASIVETAMPAQVMV
jgi:hypothetical protein